MLARHGTLMAARLGRLARRAGLALAGTALGAMGSTCFPVPQDVILSTNDGSPILMSDIDPILADTGLTEAEKRQELLDLGVPEDVIDTLLRAS